MKSPAESIDRPYAITLPPRVSKKEAAHKKEHQAREADQLAFAAESTIPSLEPCDWTGNVNGGLSACVNCRHRRHPAMECELHDAPTLPTLVCPDWDPA